MQEFQIDLIKIENRIINVSATSLQPGCHCDGDIQMAEPESEAREEVKLCTACKKVPPMEPYSICLGCAPSAMANSRNALDCRLTNEGRAYLERFLEARDLVLRTTPVAA